MRVLPSRGMPAAGSVQDLIAVEMVLRERRRALTEHSYIGRILASSLNLPEKLFQLWTSLLSLEVFQENYTPDAVNSKKATLDRISKVKEERATGNQRMFNRLHKLTAEDADLTPATPEDIERLKRKLRKKRLEMSTRKD